LNENFKLNACSIICELNFVEKLEAYNKSKNFNQIFQEAFNLKKKSELILGVESNTCKRSKLLSLSVYGNNTILYCFDFLNMTITIYGNIYSSINQDCILSKVKVMNKFTKYYGSLKKNERIKYIPMQYLIININHDVKLISKEEIECKILCCMIANYMHKKFIYDISFSKDLYSIVNFWKNNNFESDYVKYFIASYFIHSMEMNHTVFHKYSTKLVNRTEIFTTHTILLEKRDWVIITDKELNEKIKNSNVNGLDKLYITSDFSQESILTIDEILEGECKLLSKIVYQFKKENIECKSEIVFDFNNVNCLATAILTKYMCKHYNINRSSNIKTSDVIIIHQNEYISNFDGNVYIKPLSFIDEIEEDDIPFISLLYSIRSTLHIRQSSVYVFNTIFDYLHSSKKNGKFNIIVYFHDKAELGLEKECLLKRKDVLIIFVDIRLSPTLQRIEYTVNCSEIHKYLSGNGIKNKTSLSVFNMKKTEDKNVIKIYKSGLGCKINID
jgi:hypothetical protein